MTDEDTQQRNRLSNSDYPLLKYYRGMPSKKLSRDEAAAADFDTRINSIGQYLAGRTSTFFFSLSNEGRISFGPDDILGELWVELKEKDSHYDSSKGSYLKFASIIIARKFIDLREHSRCVRMPQNSSTAFQVWGEAEARGELVVSQQRLLRQMLAAGRDHFALCHKTRYGRKNRYGLRSNDNEREPQDESATPPEELEQGEHEDEYFRELAEKICTLTAMESAVLGATLGLWGQGRCHVAEVALQYGKDARLMRRTLRSARKKLGITARQTQ